jgi:hypothetical protein
MNIANPIITIPRTPVPVAESLDALPAVTAAIAAMNTAIEIHSIRFR